MVEPTTHSDRLRTVVATNVKTRRLRLGLSQEEFAALCGYHRTYVGSVERGERNITLSTLAALAIALQTTPEHLLKSDDG